MRVTQAYEVGRITLIGEVAVLTQRTSETNVAASEIGFARDRTVNPDPAIFD